MPWLRAPSRTRNGNRPFPAMSPQPVEPGAVPVRPCLVSVASVMRWPVGRNYSPKLLAKTTCQNYLPKLLAKTTCQNYLPKLLDDSPFRSLDKPDELRHIGGIRQRSTHLAQRLIRVQL